jgi:hypothetical protein
METMTDKAEKLIKEYSIYFPEFYNDKEYDYNTDKAKQCALIAIDEVIRALEEHNWQNRHVIEEYEQLKKEFYEGI